MKRSHFLALSLITIAGGATAVGVNRMQLARAASTRTATLATSSSSSSASNTAPPVGSAAPASSSFVGVLLAPQAVEVATRLEGKLVSMRVKMGDHVTRDQVLASLDNRSLKHELAQAQAGRRAALAEAGRASADFANARGRTKRRETVVKYDGMSIPIVSAEEAASSKFEASSAASRAAGAGATASGAAARVDELKLQLEQADVRAPFDGIVTTVYSDVGAYVRPGLALVRVMSSEGLHVRFAVPEESASRARAQTEVDVELGGGGAVTKMRARVTGVAPEIEPSSRTTFVDAALLEQPAADDRASLAGRVVRVTFR